MSKPGRLEDDLRELMSALKRNGADDWPGKPTQEPLKLDPTEVDLVAEDDPETEEGELPRDVRVVSLHHSSPVTNASADAERRALDTLMSEYVGAVAQARRADAEPPARTASDSAQEPPPPQSMQELLDALDGLPPLR